MNSKWENLPYDILYEILIIKSLSDQHDIFKNCLNKISHNAAKKKIKYIERLYMENLEKNIFADSIEDTILANTSSEERIWLLKEINNCNCCEKHSKNKPTIYDYENGLVPEYSSKNNSNRLCLCECRHISRCICRAQNDEIIINI